MTAILVAASTKIKQRDWDLIPDYQDAQMSQIYDQLIK